jgi:hypothetical protein
MVVDRSNEVAVLGEIPSLKNIPTSIVYTIMPIPKPIKREGHNNPLLPSTLYFIAIINKYEIGIPSNETISGCSLNETHMN